ncbi:MAG: hypothetical protein JWP44_4921 [Mucilaginibacter sp.]|nr:hypothetical protein [Mucilaginibacter sp.]
MALDAVGGVVVEVVFEEIGCPVGDVEGCTFGDVDGGVDVGVGGDPTAVPGLGELVEEVMVDFEMVSPAVGKASRCAVLASGPQWKYSYVWSTPKVRNAIEQYRDCGSEGVLVAINIKLTLPSKTGMPYQVHVVMTGLLLRLPQPEVHVFVSKQYPPRPQSVASITVVGQNPQIPCAVSTRQS